MITISFAAIALLGLGLFGMPFGDDEPAVESEPPDPNEPSYGLDLVDEAVVLFGNDGADLLIGAENDQQITAGDGDDTIQAGGGSDTISAGGGRDLVDAGRGNDRVFAGTGFDTVFGGAGDDQLYGRGGNDRLFGGPGDDVMSGEQGNDRLRDDLGEDTMLGRTGNDTLVAYDIEIGASDRLRGDEGDDVLKGDDGDTLIGGAGQDEFYITATRSGAETVVIEDLWDGEAERTNDFEMVFFVTDSGKEIDGDLLAKNLLIIREPSGGSALLYDGETIAHIRGISPDVLNSQSDWIGNFSLDIA